MMRLLALLILTVLFTSCKQQVKNVHTDAPLEVGVSLPIVKEIIDWAEYTGRFQPVNQVNVVARVSGFLEKVNFRDGQMVQKGDLLFNIDSYPFTIAVAEAKAKYDEAKLLLEQSKEEYNRTRDIQSSGAIATEEIEQRKIKMLSTQAGLDYAKALLNKAKLQLDYTYVRAPISGRIGRNLVDRGNIISGGGTGEGTILATIVSLDPIHFYFTASEADKLKYSRMARSGAREDSRYAPNPLFVRLIDETDYIHEGKMDFVDNRIDNSTGTIEARAIVNNPDYLLEPGMFGKAKLLSSKPYQATLIPDKFIHFNQTEQFVYIVSNHTVKTSLVELGPLYKGGLRVIRSGISKGDTLATTNLLQLRPDMEIKPIPAPINANK